MSRVKLKQLAGDSLIYGVSGIIGRFISVFLIPVYTRVFAPEEYGVIGLVTNMFTLLSILVVLGLDNSMARWFYDDDDDEDRKVTLNTFLWSCLAGALFLMVLVVIFHDSVATHVFREPRSSSVLLIAAFNLPLTVFVTFTSNVLRIQRRPFAISIFAVSISLVTVVLSIAFVVVLRLGVAGVFYAQISASTIAVIWTIFLFRKIISLRYFSQDRWRKMFLFSYPLVPGSIAFWVINLSGVYFVQFMTNSREVGLFQIGAMIASGMALITSSFQSAWGPFAFSIYKQPGSKDVYAQTLVIYLALASLVAVFITMFSYELLSIATTDSYLGAYLVTGILCFNHLVVGLGYIASIGPSIAKNNKMYGIASVASAGVLVLLCLTLVPVLGKEGAALASLASQIIIPIAVFWHGQRLYPIPYKFVRASLILISSLIVSFGTVLLLNELSLSRYFQFGAKMIVGLAFAGALLYIVKSEIPSSPLVTTESLLTE